MKFKCAQTDLKKTLDDGVALLQKEKTKMEVWNLKNLINKIARTETKKNEYYDENENPKNHGLGGGIRKFLYQGLCNLCLYCQNRNLYILK